MKNENQTTVEDPSIIGGKPTRPKPTYTKDEVED